VKKYILLNKTNRKKITFTKVCRCVAFVTVVNKNVAFFCVTAFS